VLVISIHADPNAEYPFNFGFENQTGEGEGEGYTLNICGEKGFYLFIY
jgi:acetoin utilization deacetylase AcuC-like enzyme